MIKSRFKIFYFNMIEIALALVVLAVGLSSVLVLFPIGANAGKSSVNDNNLTNVAEQVINYLQAEYTPDNWEADGELKTNSVIDLDEFTEEPGNDEVKAEDLDDEIDGHSGLYTKSGKKGWFRYVQYSELKDGASTEKVAEFEAMIRVGTDNDSMLEQYYPSPVATGTDKWKKLSTYTPASGSGINSNLQGNASAVLKKIYQPLIIEISWPADVPWAQREKRTFRMDVFNENFVPYPLPGGSGGGN